jgi:prolyl 4-hydroxylase
MSDSVVCAQAEHETDETRAVARSDILAWIAERHAERHGAAQIFNGMRDSGWSGDDAVAALLEALPCELHEQVRALSRGAPDPDLSGSSSAIAIDGHTVHVLFEMQNPRLVIFGNLVTREECDELIAGASPRLKRSMVKGDDDELQLDDRRTSWGMVFEHHETPLCTRLESRISALLDWPSSSMEKMQVLRYSKGQRCEPHHDYFKSEEGVWSPVFRRGGQRVGTLLIYLNTPPLGGSTLFPDIPLEVRAIAGNAVFFAYDTPDATSRSLHGGARVGDGEKWLATTWFRQGPCA